MLNFFKKNLGSGLISALLEQILDQIYFLYFLPLK